MALLPFILDELESGRIRPSRILDQHFGLGLEHEDFLAPFTLPSRAVHRSHPGYVRPWRANSAVNDTGSTVTIDKNKYQVHLDVQQFNPEEVTVKVSGKNMIVVEGKHDEKQDQHGFISRHFLRKYVIPEGHDINQVVSTLSSDGVLTITAPKTDRNEDEERMITITQTGIPSKVIEKKTEDKQQ